MKHRKRSPQSERLHNPADPQIPEQHPRQRRRRQKHHDVVRNIQTFFQIKDRQRNGAECRDVQHEKVQCESSQPLVADRRQHPLPESGPLRQTGGKLRNPGDADAASAEQQCSREQDQLQFPDGRLRSEQHTGNQQKHDRCQLMAKPHTAEKLRPGLPGQKRIKHRIPPRHKSGHSKSKQNNTAGQDSDPRPAEPRSGSGKKIHRRSKNQHTENKCTMPEPHHQIRHRNHAEPVEKRQKRRCQQRQHISRAKHSCKQDDNGAVRQHHFSGKTAAGRKNRKPLCGTDGRNGTVGIHRIFLTDPAIFRVGLILVCTVVRCFIIGRLMI